MGLPPTVAVLDPEYYQPTHIGPKTRKSANEGNYTVYFKGYRIVCSTYYLNQYFMRGKNWKC